MRRTCTAAAVVLVFGLGTIPAQEKQDDGDPLPVKSQWKGKLTQRGKIMGHKEVPPEFDTLLTITARKGNDFDCTLREKTGADTVTYVCKGKISIGEKGSVKVDFESISAASPSQEFIAVTRVPYTGAITGKTLKGTWKSPPNKEDTELDGAFTLERQ